jgi:hypothetical protein
VRSARYFSPCQPPPESIQMALRNGRALWGRYVMLENPARHLEVGGILILHLGYCLKSNLARSAVLR